MTTVPGHRLPASPDDVRRAFNLARLALIASREAMLDQGEDQGEEDEQDGHGHVSETGYNRPVPVRNRPSKTRYRMLREVAEDKTHGYFRVAIPPGTRPSDVEITLDKDVVAIRASHQRTWSADETIVGTEMPYGECSAELKIPKRFDLASVDAQFLNGLVVISFAKRPDAITTTARSIPLRTPTVETALESSTAQSTDIPF